MKGTERRAQAFLRFVNDQITYAEYVRSAPGAPEYVLTEAGARPPGGRAVQVRTRPPRAAAG